MVKKITRDPMFLAQKSVDATEADKQVITDLLDTLRANLDHCVGMAANMIGVSKNIIVVAAGTISVCNDQSGDHKENRGFSDGGRLPFAGWSKTMHKIQRN